MGLSSQMCDNEKHDSSFCINFSAYKINIPCSSCSKRSLRHWALLDKFCKNAIELWFLDLILAKNENKTSVSTSEQ